MVLYIIINNINNNYQINEIIYNYFIYWTFCKKYNINFISQSFTTKYGNIIQPINSFEICSNFIEININQYLSNMILSLDNFINSTDNYHIIIDNLNSNLFLHLMEYYIKSTDISKSINIHKLISNEDEIICIDFYNGNIVTDTINYISDSKFLDTYQHMISLNKNIKLYLIIYETSNLEFIKKNFINYFLVNNQVEQYNLLFHAKYKILSSSDLSKLISFLQINDIVDISV